MRLEQVSPEIWLLDPSVVLYWCAHEKENQGRYLNHVRILYCREDGVYTAFDYAPRWDLQHVIHQLGGTFWREVSDEIHTS